MLGDVTLQAFSMQKIETSKQEKQLGGTQNDRYG
jgi:hypothetical protein